MKNLAWPTLLFYIALAACNVVPEVDTGCSAGGSGTSTATTTTTDTTCASIEDCVAHLTPGPCGALACDPLGLVGEPEIQGVPRGCYVQITSKCETPTNIEGPCSADSDCIPLKCFSASCVAGRCSLPAEPKGTPCDAQAACDGAGHCVAN